jgi:hypothetical protein
MGKTAGFILIMLFALATPVGAEEWVLKHEADGIVVHTRPVAGSTFEEFRGRALVSANLESVLRVLIDGDRYQDWFPDCPQSKLLDRESDVQRQYAVTAAPWPVKDRDAIYQYSVSRDSSGAFAKVEIQAAPDAYPLQDSMVRVQVANGSWTIQAANDGQTDVTFQMHLEPGGSIPSVLANARVVATSAGALAGLRIQVAKDLD